MRVFKSNLSEEELVLGISVVLVGLVYGSK